MGVYEKHEGSGVWWVLWYGPDGRHREKVGRKSDAQKLYYQRKADAAAGKKLAGPLRERTATFGEMIDKAMDWVERNRPRSYRDYKYKAKLLKMSLGLIAIDALTSDDFEEFVDDREVSNATFNRYRAFVSMVYRRAVKKRAPNLAREVEHRRESDGRKRFFSRNEFTLISDGCRTPDHRAAFHLATYTGMRLSEQFTAEIRQIDWERQLLRLDLTKNGDGRDVPLNSEAMAALRVLVGDRTEGLIHPRQRGGKGAVDNEWFRSLLRRLGLRDASWHTNRHTFCSWHAAAGTPLRTIQELAGHRSIHMTTRYAHLCPEYKQTEAERIVPNAKVLEMARRPA